MSRKRNLSRTSIFVRDDQLQQLRLISAETGATIAFMVRRGIDNYLEGRLLSPKNLDSHGEVTSESS